MSEIPNFQEIEWEGGPRSSVGLTDWQSATGRSSEKLLQPTPELIPIKPLYSSADLEGLEHLHSMPGIPPFVRGPYLTMYAGRPWTIRQYAGFSTPKSPTRFIAETWRRGRTGSRSLSTWLPTAATIRTTTGHWRRRHGRRGDR